MTADRASADWEQVGAGLARPPMTRVDSNVRLASWFKQWRLPIRKFLHSRGVVPLADLDDIAQEVFLRLMHYERTGVIESPRAYLYRIASNVAAEWSLRARYAKRHEPEWLAELPSEDRPDENVERDIVCDEIARAVGMLTARQRKVVKLLFAEALGHAEIAERLGTTPRSIKRIVTKSYQKLRQELSPELLGTIARGRERP